MDYVIAGAAGLAFGVLVGLLKYLLLWKPLVLGKKEFTQNKLLTAQMLSFAINIVALLCVFLLRNVWPYSFEVTLVATALGLVASGRFSTIRDSKKFDTPTAATTTDVEDASVTPDDND